MTDEIIVRITGDQDTPGERAAEQRFDSSGAVTIGRLASASVAIPDTPSHHGVSRDHARIVYEPQGWFYIDNGSRNGSFLNTDQKVARVPINNGISVHLGLPGNGATLDIWPASAQPTTASQHGSTPTLRGEGKTILVGNRQTPNPRSASNGSGDGHGIVVETQEQRYEFEQGRERSIGRDSSCDVRLSSDTASNKHATLHNDGAHWIVSDTSSNGIWQHRRRQSTLVLQGVQRVEFGAKGRGEWLTFTTSGEHKMSNLDRIALVGKWKIVTAASLTIALIMGALVWGTRSSLPVSKKDIVARSAVVSYNKGEQIPGVVLEGGVLLTLAAPFFPHGAGEILRNEARDRQRGLLTPQKPSSKQQLSDPYGSWPFDDRWQPTILADTIIVSTAGSREPSAVQLSPDSPADGLLNTLAVPIDSTNLNTVRKALVSTDDKVKLVHNSVETEVVVKDYSVISEIPGLKMFRLDKRVTTVAEKDFAGAPAFTANGDLAGIFGFNPNTREQVLFPLVDFEQLIAAAKHKNVYSSPFYTTVPNSDVASTMPDVQVGATPEPDGAKLSVVESSDGTGSASCKDLNGDRRCNVRPSKGSRVVTIEVLRMPVEPDKPIDLEAELKCEFEEPYTSTVQGVNGEFTTYGVGDSALVDPLRTRSIATMAASKVNVVATFNIARLGTARGWCRFWLRYGGALAKVKLQPVIIHVNWQPKLKATE